MTFPIRSVVRWHARCLVALALLVAGAFASPSAGWAQATDDPEWLDTPIAVTEDPVADAAIASRLEGLYGRLDGLAGVTVAVEGGIVRLGGEVANDTLGDRAGQVARRVEGVVAVEDDINRTLDVSENVGALNADIAGWVERVRTALPLILLALASWIGLILAGRFLAGRLVATGGIPGRRSVNPFLAEVLGQVVKIAFFVAGLVLALNLVGASGLVATVLGGAGVLGIAFGFAIRDTLENYISSILLSIRQPFRTADHVVINGTHEGKVARLTSRATILVTLDGNQLRIPNADVFKGTILNYTTNPERRFTFRLGVDSADNPVAAIQAGTAEICDFDFVLREPAPKANIIEVGDSSIVIEFTGWVNQNASDFASARSAVIQAVKARLERDGFSLPEPIYRLKIDGLDVGGLPKSARPAAAAARATPATASSASPPSSHASPQSGAEISTAPDMAVEEKVREEAAKGNLLDDGAAVE